MPCHWEVCLVISVVQESNCQVWRCFPKRSVNVPSHKSWTLGWSEALLGPFKKCFSPPKFLPSPPNVMKTAALFFRYFISTPFPAESLLFNAFLNRQCQLNRNKRQDVCIYWETILTSASVWFFVMNAVDIT